MQQYLVDRLKQQLEEFQYKGIIFRCQNELYWRYSDKLKDVLSFIGYLPIAQDIPQSEKIYGYLHKRLKEKLPTQIEETVDKLLGAGISVDSLFTAKAEFSKNIKLVFERAQTLQGLIEDYLTRQWAIITPEITKLKSIISQVPFNLMVIISNADDFTPTDFIRIIGDIFNAGTSSKHKACLTMICFLPTKSNYLDPTNLRGHQSWFVFNPEQELEPASEFIWKNLAKEDQYVFNNNMGIFKNLLMRSNCSPAIFRENGDRIWKKIEKEGKDNIGYDDLKVLDQLPN
jgi:hypothetical protein